MVVESENQAAGYFTLMLYVSNPPAPEYSGTISANVTWSGTVTVSGNLTIASGATLTVMPGTIINFVEGVSFTVNGTLVAAGTDSRQIAFRSALGTPYRGAWSGVVLNGGPNSLAYCTVEHAIDGIRVMNGSTNIIDHCTIQHCYTNGILGYNTSKAYGALTVSNTLLQNNGRGIGLGNARADLLSDDLSQNDSQGILVTSSSVCYSTYSHFEENGLYGTYLTGTTSAMTFGGRYYEQGHNTIHDNNTTGSSNCSECGFGSEGTGYIGYDDCGDEYWGHNNIYHGENPPQGHKLLVNNSSSGIMAQFTFWNYTNGPPSTEFQGYVNYSEWLTALQKVAPFRTPTVTVPSVRSDQNVGMDPKADRLLKRMQVLVSRDSDSSLPALAMIASIVGPAGAYASQIEGGWDSYLLSTATNSKNRNLKEKAIAYWYDAVSANAAPSSRAWLADSLIGLSAGSRIGTFYQEKRFFSAIDQREFTAARTLLEAMKSKEEDPHAIRFFAEMLSSAEASKGMMPPAGRAQQSLPSGVGRSDALQMDQNYPNPFNPITRISYKLNEPSRVHVTVYDVLGQAVTDLVDGYNETGDHSVTWDGSQCGSGVYFARIEITTLSGHTFTRTRKMALTK